MRTAINSGLVLFLIAAAGVFGWVITFEQVPQMVADSMSARTLSPFVFLMLLLGVGMLLDGIAALILVVPILLPIATQQFGISPFHFGVLVCLNLVLGLLTPSVGTGLFVASAMTGVAPMRLFRALMPFIVTVYGLLVRFSYEGRVITALIEK